MSSVPLKLSIVKHHWLSLRLPESHSTIFCWTAKHSVATQTQQSQSLRHTQTHNDTHTQTHAHTRTHTHAHTQIKPLILLGPLTGAHGNKLTQPQVHMKKQTRTSTCKHIHMHRRTHFSYTHPISDNSIIILTIWPNLAALRGHNNWGKINEKGHTDRDLGWEPCCPSSRLHQNERITSVTWKRRREDERLEQNRQTHQSWWPTTILCIQMTVNEEGHNKENAQTHTHAHKHT